MNKSILGMLRRKLSRSRLSNFKTWQYFAQFKSRNTHVTTDGNRPGVQKLHVWGAEDFDIKKVKSQK